MPKNNTLKNNNQSLERIEKKVFDKICSVLVRAGWDPIIENDPDWKWIILATHQYPGSVFQSIQPKKILGRSLYSNLHIDDLIYYPLLSLGTNFGFKNPRFRLILGGFPK